MSIDPSTSAEWEVSEALVSLIEHVRDGADHEAVVVQQTRFALSLCKFGEAIGTELIGTVRDVLVGETA